MGDQLRTKPRNVGVLTNSREKFLSGKLFIANLFGAYQYSVDCCIVLHVLSTCILLSKLLQTFLYNLQ